VAGAAPGTKSNRQGKPRIASSTGNEMASARPPSSSRISKNCASRTRHLSADRPEIRLPALAITKRRRVIISTITKSPPPRRVRLSQAVEPHCPSRLKPWIFRVAPSKVRGRLEPRGLPYFQYRNSKPGRPSTFETGDLGSYLNIKHFCLSRLDCLRTVVN